MRGGPRLAKCREQAITLKFPQGSGGSQAPGGRQLPFHEMFLEQTLRSLRTFVRQNH